MFCTVADVIAEVLVLSSNPALWAWWDIHHGLHSCLQSSNLSLFAGFQSSAGGCYRTWPRKCWHGGGSPVSSGVTILTIGHPRPSRSRMPRSFLVSHQLPEKSNDDKKKNSNSCNNYVRQQCDLFTFWATPHMYCSILPSHCAFWTEMYHQQSASLSDRTPCWTIVITSATWKLFV